MIGDRATIEAERGISLEETWRLPPAICAMTSDLFDGRLRALAGLERRRLVEAGELRWGRALVGAGGARGADGRGAGGVEVIGDIVARLPGGATWIDMQGDEKRIAGGDALVIAPYDAQVAVLESALGPRGCDAAPSTSSRGRRQRW